MNSKIKKRISSLNLSKKQIVGIVAGIILVIGVIIALIPKGVYGTYSKTEGKGTDVDIIVLDGKKYKSIWYDEDFKTGKMEKVGEYSGTFEVKDNEITFFKDTWDGKTGTLSKNGKILNMQNGAQLVKKD
ncbi:hypothetical protein [Pediococcus acidilactici]|uniref:hypothetical protein n=1 Tax=Pediococcus acidilactici TaxID=1254 RepID=UPI00137C0054|nr:hypothetical protein [Pediococcus acidilactici]QHS02493.1 hypothetical protein GWA24_01495 [Pediococcus acidilactici]